MRISDLTTTTAAALADQFPVFSATDNDTRKVLASQLVTLMQASLTFPTTALTQQYAAPSATGFSVTVTVGNTWLVLTPVAGYATGTIILPASRTNNQVVEVNCTQSVTTLTVSGAGTTVTGAPATLAANSFFRVRYDGVLNAWYRVG